MGAPPPLVTISLLFLPCLGSFLHFLLFPRLPPSPHHPSGALLYTTEKQDPPSDSMWHIILKLHLRRRTAFPAPGCGDIPRLRDAFTVCHALSGYCAKCCSDSGLSCSSQWRLLRPGETPGSEFARRMAAPLFSETSVLAFTGVEWNLSPKRMRQYRKPHQTPPTLPVPSVSERSLLTRGGDTCHLGLPNNT